MKKIGVIGIKNAWSSEQLYDFVKRKTGNSVIIEMDRVHFDSEKESVFFNGMDLGTFDALIIKKISREYSPDNLNKLEILRYLKDRHKIKIFSDPLKIMELLNRLSCTIALQANGLPMPPTVITEDTEEAIAAIKHFKNAVLKPLFSTKAKGMKLVSSDDDVTNIVKTFVSMGNRTIYIQKMLDIPEKDFGVVFLGGKYLATYARSKTGNVWNTTTSFGGKYMPHEPSDRIIEIAEAAQKLFGLDFTSVDIAETEKKVYVFEVSAFGGFRGLMEAWKINAADLYTDYVLKELG